MATCIDLLARYGDRYRTGLDPAAESRSDPWMRTIPGRFGLIYPFGGDLLAVECDHHPQVAKKLAALPGLTLLQDGDREKTFVFDVADFEAVAALVQPRRRRRLSEDSRAALVEAGRRFRFGNGGQDDNSGQGSVAAAEPDPGDA